MLVWLERRTVPQDRVSTRCYLAGRYKLGRSSSNSNLLRGQSGTANLQLLKRQRNVMVCSLAEYSLYTHRSFQHTFVAQNVGQLYDGQSRLVGTSKCIYGTKLQYTRINPILLVRFIQRLKPCMLETHIHLINVRSICVLSK